MNIVDHVLWLMKVLSYGRKRKVILEAPLYDKDCVLGSILAAHFLSSSDPSRANSYVEAAASNLVSLLYPLSLYFRFYFGFEETS